MHHYHICSDHRYCIYLQYKMTLHVRWLLYRLLIFLGMYLYRMYLNLFVIVR